MTKTIPTFLLPCPFCGHDLDAKWDRLNPNARCLTEACKGRQLPVLNLDQPDDIAAWNRRAPVDYAALMNSMTAILEHLGLDPANLPSGSYSEIVIGSMQVRHAETQRLLRDLAEWIDDMPVPTRGATAMLQRIDKAQQVAHTQHAPKSASAAQEA